MRSDLVRGDGSGELSSPGRIARNIRSGGAYSQCKQSPQESSCNGKRKRDQAGEIDPAGQDQGWYAGNDSNDEPIPQGGLRPSTKDKETEGKGKKRKEDIC
jgi:hypothetical protein